MNIAAKTQLSVPTDEAMAIHLLRALTHLSRHERLVHLGDVATEAGVRKTDARRILRQLDQQGLVDVMRMRPTLAGFAIGASLDGATLAPLRKERFVTEHIPAPRESRAA